MAIFYSLISMGFAGVNDLVFKKYGEKKRPVGIFVAAIGVIWTVFFLSLGSIKGSLSFGPAAILIGSFSGIASALSNIIFIETMKKTGAGVGSTIYRLNLIFVAILAFIFLNESFTPFKFIGLGLAIGTILVIFKDNHKVEGESIKKYIYLLVLASFLRACMGISYKFASIYSVSNESFLAINGFFWLVFGMLYLFYKEKNSEVDRSVIKYSAISGILVCGIVLFLRLAVNRGDASIVVTISQLSFLVTFPCSICFLKEKFNAKKGLALALATLCIIAFSMA